MWGYRQEYEPIRYKQTSERRERKPITRPTAQKERVIIPFHYHIPSYEWRYTQPLLIEEESSIFSKKKKTQPEGRRRAIKTRTRNNMWRIAKTFNPKRRRSIPNPAQENFLKKKSHLYNFLCCFLMYTQHTHQPKQ